jgi:serine/threonine protein kinase
VVYLRGEGRPPTPGGPLTKLLASDGEGERLDRFELVAELASGGMATVYLARLSSVAGFQRLYAIKRLHPHLQREPEFVDMFLDEARLAARIHHPNVVSILEVGESKRGYYLVMEYIEGDTLARLLARSAQAQAKLPVDVTVRIALDTLAGLDAAHDLKDDHDQPLGVVHRDVSPQNILVGIDGTTRITDFGVARAAARLTTTRTGQLKGKLAYMAPEQARGQAVDRRADLFALGIVLWEALAMKRLFKGEGEADTLSRVLSEPIPKLRTLVPTLPRWHRGRGREGARSRSGEALRHRRPNSRATSKKRPARSVPSAPRRTSAACLDALMGGELTEQRAAVRTWLAQSEPSKSSVTRKPSDSVVTRIEGRRADESGSSPSAAGPAISVPHAAASSTLAPSHHRRASGSHRCPDLGVGGEPLGHHRAPTHLAAGGRCGPPCWSQASSGARSSRWSYASAAAHRRQGSRSRRTRTRPRPSPRPP